MVFLPMAASMVRANEEGNVESAFPSGAVETTYTTAVSALPDKSAETSGAEAPDGGGMLVEETEEEDREGNLAVEGMEGRRSSVSSNDSFYSAQGEDEVMDLYMAARRLVQDNSVQYRKNR